MGKQVVTCETVSVIVDDGQGFHLGLTIPAYTRPELELQVILHDLITEYMERSESRGEPVSLGDFALFALERASSDPRNQS